MVHALSEQFDHAASAETNIDDLHRAHSSVDFSSSAEILS
jgi:hypothetical protein